jgi:PAS domain S-box-containing protein
MAAKKNNIIKHDRMQDLFMQAPAIIAILRGKNHVFELANPLYMQLVGPKRTIIGQTVRKALPEIKGQGFFELLDKVYATGEPFQGNEVPAKIDVNNDGQLKTVYLNFVYQPLKNTQGKVEGIFVHAVDVTEQVLARQKVKESEDRFRTLIEQSTDAIQLVNPEGKIIYTSESIKNVLGYTPEELQGTVATPYLHPEDVTYFYQKIQDLLKNPQKPVTMQYRVKHKDGSWVWLETTGVNHLNTPNINALVGTFRNITGRKQVEEALRQAQNRYEKLFNSNLMGIYISHFDGTIREANEVFLSMVGYSKKDLKEGKIRWDTMTPPEYKQLDIEKDKELRETGQATPWEKAYKRKDGNELPVLVGALITEESSNACLMFAVDISERKKLERQKDDFLAIASHELKTPVTSLKVYAQALESKFRRQGDMYAADQLKKMDTQVNKLSNLISDLLDVSKIEAGKLRFTEDYFDFNELVNEIVEEIQRTTDKHTIIKKLAETKRVYGDRDRLGQVIINYLTNAIKYSPQSNKIIVKTLTSRNYELVLYVQDNGVGIPIVNKNKVFQRFYRVSGERKETYPGLGLGLYISSEIIKRHGGKVWVESNNSKGSKFYFSIPLVKKKKARS